MFICDFALPGFKMGKRWHIQPLQNIIQTIMELETRLLNFGHQNPLDGSRQVLSFSFALQRQEDRDLWTRW